VNIICQSSEKKDLDIFFSPQIFTIILKQEYQWNWWMFLEYRHCRSYGLRQALQRFDPLQWPWLYGPVCSTDTPPMRSWYTQSNQNLWSGQALQWFDLWPLAVTLTLGAIHCLFMIHTSMKFHHKIVNGSEVMVLTWGYGPVWYTTHHLVSEW